MSRHSKRNVVLARREKVAALSLQGHTQTEIAREVGISQMAVSKHLARCRAEWAAATARDTAERIAEEIAQLLLIRREAWSAWNDSRRPVRVGEGKRARTVRGKGDPAFLKVVDRTNERMLTLLGALKAPPIIVQQFDWGGFIRQVAERAPIPDAVVDAIVPDPLQAAIAEDQAALPPPPGGNGTNGYSPHPNDGG